MDLTDDNEYAKAVVAELLALATQERDGLAEKTTLVIGPFTTYTLIGILQLAWRHPGLSSDQREIIKTVVQQLEPMFSGLVAETIRDGWNPDLDR